jgi:hypothetical protein
MRIVSQRKQKLREKKLELEKAIAQKQKKYKNVKSRYKDPGPGFHGTKTS